MKPANASARLRNLIGPSLGASVALATPALAQTANPPVGTPAQNTTQNTTQGTTTAPAPTTNTTPTATAPAAATPAAPAAPPASWASTITYGLQFDGGVIANPSRPSDGLNYGRLFDDKSNSPQLNQIQGTITRPINSSATGYDFGFTLQGTYGTDVRYLHYLGEFDYLTDSRYQLTLLQANVLMHAPWLTAGGIDFKLGQFVTPIGYETIDPSTNPFYSHSYIFNYGPFQHTGLQGIWHVNPTLDIYAQIDTGESTTFGANSGDNNSEPAGLVGFGLNNLAGGKLTLLALSHMGPENALRIDPQANGQMRYENDFIATYKPNAKLTYVLELNDQHDDSIGADAYGGAGYISYALTPTVTLNGRAEIYRDNTGFFVGEYPGTLDAVNALAGRPNTSFSDGRNTNSEYTLGVTYKPTIKRVALLAFRPEIRWDKSLSGNSLFTDRLATGAFTFGGDIILGF